MAIRIPLRNIVNSRPSTPPPSQPTTAPGGWIYKSTNYTASVKERIIADTTTSTITITLPANPTEGDYVVISDGGNWSVKNLIIERNGKTIQGKTSNLTLDNGGTTVELAYSQNTWEVFNISSSLGKNSLTTVTPEEFGAVGNGINDDQPAWQAAINYCKSKGGGIINGRPGATYLFNSFHVPTPPQPYLYEYQDFSCPCLIIDGAENITLNGNGCEINFGSNINNGYAYNNDVLGYLFLLVITGQDSYNNQKFTRNIHVNDFKIIKSRGSALNGKVVGTIATNSAEDVYYKNIKIRATQTNIGHLDTAFNGTNNRRVYVQNCDVAGVYAGFDIAGWEDCVISDNYFHDEGIENPSGIMGAITVLNHFYDNATSPVSYLETPFNFTNANNKKIATNLKILNNRVKGFENGFRVSSIEGVLIDGNVIEGRVATSSAQVSSGIEVSLDNDGFSYGTTVGGVNIVNNTIYNLIKNTGIGQGIFLGTVGGTRPFSNVIIDNNKIYDNKDHGIRIDLNVTNLKIGTNDFTSRNNSGVQVTNITAAAGLESGEVNLTDDTKFDIYPPKSSGKVLFTTDNSIINNAEFYYDVVSGIAQTGMVGMGSSVMNVLLFGNTGKDGNITYSAYNNGIIYVENRTGATRKINYKFD